MLTHSIHVRTFCCLFCSFFESGSPGAPVSASAMTSLKSNLDCFTIKIWIQLLHNSQTHLPVCKYQGNHFQGECDWKKQARGTWHHSALAACFSPLKLTTYQLMAKPVVPCIILSEPTIVPTAKYGSKLMQGKFNFHHPDSLSSAGKNIEKSFLNTLLDNWDV